MLEIAHNVNSLINVKFGRHNFYFKRVTQVFLVLPEIVKHTEAYMPFYINTISERLAI